MLPERDPSKPAEEQGLFQKFEVRRTDGSSEPGGKHHVCDYFVLDMNHDPLAKPALQAYAAACEATHPQLAADLRTRFGQAEPAALAMDDELLFILGRPNFMCGTVAEIMRASGVEIEQKSEHEQAHVILLMLNCYLSHGKDWKDAMETKMEEFMSQARANQIIKG